MTQAEKRDDKDLAKQYREAAKDDAWHERDGNRRGGAGEDATINATPETQDAPLSDVAHPDPADGENHAAPPSPKGPEYDKLMRGYEPGEMAGES